MVIVWSEMGVSSRLLVRLTLLGVIAFALLLIAAAIGFRDNLFKHLTNPRSPFVTTTPPPAPDYAMASTWARRPDSVGPAQAAVFFVHPTTYWGGSRWNAPILGGEAQERLDGGVIPTHAGPFMEVGAVYAPRYRQSSLYTFLTHHYDAQRARAFAYEDVAAAFDAFVRQVPPDAPIIVAGVEQGGLHVLGLLQDKFRTPSMRQRLVAAYVIDQATPLDLFEGPLSGVAPCREPDDVRCVVSWGPVDAENPREIRRFQDRSMTWDQAGRLVETRNRALHCVNPIQGAATEDYVPARNHKGAVDASGLEAGVTPAPLANQTSAQCQDGALLVDEPKSRSLRPRFSLGVRFKPPVANLFYADTAADVTKRYGAFLILREEEGRMAPPIDTVISIVDSPINPVPEIEPEG